MQRVQTGWSELDSMLGGGLLPGTLAVVLGASGIGKTQLGVLFGDAGKTQEGKRGVVFDMTSRGDSQNHIDYAARLCDWEMRSQQPDTDFEVGSLFSGGDQFDHLHLFRQTGKRVTSADLSEDEWREWKYEHARKLDRAIAFFYRNFIRGVRRCVIDGIEPTERASDSIQFELFEYIYHQILRKEHDWVARDLLRVRYRDLADRVASHAYDHKDLTCVLLCTTHEVMLDDLLTRPLESGDVLSNANTIIMMGKTREGNRMGRALHVAKHRGSACDESIVPYEIHEGGFRLV